MGGRAGSAGTRGVWCVIRQVSGARGKEALSSQNEPFGLGRSILVVSDPRRGAVSRGGLRRQRPSPVRRACHKLTPFTKMHKGVVGWGTEGSKRGLTRRSISNANISSVTRAPIKARSTHRSPSSSARAALYMALSRPRLIWRAGSPSPQNGTRTLAVWPPTAPLLRHGTCAERLTPPHTSR